MIPQFIQKSIIEDDKKILNKKGGYKMPAYCPKTHYRDLCDSNYYHALIILRHNIKMVSDFYFGTKLGAKNVDLFIMTPSISSPMGPGSDSKPISLKFGELNIYLTDSSQFGFEPLLLNDFDKVYCYLPSIRGENCDKRHLSQFYHCEMEMRGEIKSLIPIIEGYIKILAEALLLMDNIIEKISQNPEKSRFYLKEIIKTKRFSRITFDEAVDALIKNNKRQLVNFTKQGRDITSAGEIELMKILKIKTSLWLTHFDRDRAPFYQKPDPLDPDKTINADLLFPPIIKGSFGGEIVGAGQRQDNSKEMRESLKRQGIFSKPYEWYIDLRKQKKYKTTSGFGFGIERFLAWVLCKDNIRDVILYPRIKNIKTYP